MNAHQKIEIAFSRSPASNPLAADARAALLNDPGFGRVFTDHMVTIRWTKDRGWHDAQVRAREPISLDPAAAVLHYGQEIFEGLKAYTRRDGSIALFRPEQNARRFRASAVRMAMPELPEALFLQAIEELVTIDAAWIPDGEGSSLYLRPFMVATEAFLGVRPSHECLFVLIASSVGSYFKGGAKAVTVWLSDRYTRAAEGGTGAAKCGGNYAASLLAQAEAIEQGCDQVVFLDAAEHRWVEELGGMNIFFVFDDGSMTTPPLSGTILPGITRDSVITLAQREGRTVREERYSIEQWRADAASGKLREVFACGTAAVVSAIGKIKSANGDIVIGDGTGGPITAALKATLVGIQRGDLADSEGWVRKVR
ncbi:MAG: branched-chain amino acid aminotransferase [Alphaproteobacteria bacterium]|nr:MAG: branched-chain amino acid aminotransferase [Alphaproteobacteria bacterium]